jgi:hypothetical protein
MLKKTDTGITDDLTPYRGKLAYLARQWAKKHENAGSWTTEGKIFLKVDQSSKPKRVMTEADIPKEEQ